MNKLLEILKRLRYEKESVATSSVYLSLVLSSLLFLQLPDVFPYFFLKVLSLILFVFSFRWGRFVIVEYRVFFLLVLFVLIHWILLPPAGLKLMLSYFYAFFVFWVYSESLVLFSTDKIVRYFIIFVFSLAVIGLIQEFLWGIRSEYFFYCSLSKNPDTVFSGRVLRIASLTSEPSQFALFLLAGIGLILTRPFSYLLLFVGGGILLALGLTFSSVGYFGVGVLFVFFTILYWSRKFWKYSFFVTVLFFSSCYFVPAVGEKIIGTGVFGNVFEINKDVLPSSSVATVGLESARETLLSGAFIGRGAGAYSMVSEPIWKKYGYGNVYDDGTHIGHFKLLVEYGIVGFLLFWLGGFFVVWKSNSDYKKLATMICVILIIVEFRSGAIVNPLSLFFWAFLFRLMYSSKKLA